MICREISAGRAAVSEDTVTMIIKFLFRAYSVARDKKVSLYIPGTTPCELV